MVAKTGRLMETSERNMRGLVRLGAETGASLPVERAALQLPRRVRHVDIDGDRPARRIDRRTHPGHAPLETSRIGNEVHSLSNANGVRLPRGNGGGQLQDLIANDGEHRRSARHTL